MASAKLMGRMFTSHTKNTLCRGPRRVLQLLPPIQMSVIWMMVMVATWCNHQSPHTHFFHSVFEMITTFRCALH